MKKIEILNGGVEYAKYEEKIRIAFDQFDKWNTYNLAFDLMDRGYVTLLDIQDIGAEYGIQPSIIAYRRREYLQYKKPIDWRAHAEMIGDYYG